MLNCAKVSLYGFVHHKSLAQPKSHTTSNGTQDNCIDDGFDKYANTLAEMDFIANICVRHYPLFIRTPLAIKSDISGFLPLDVKYFKSKHHLDSAFGRLKAELCRIALRLRYIYQKNILKLLHRNIFI